MRGENIMPKNDNAQSIRLVDSLRKNCGDVAAEELAQRYPLSKSADFEKKFKWAEGVCSYLDSNFSEDEILKIRSECRCNDGKSIADKLLKYLKGSGSIEEFVDNFNRSETFAQLVYINDKKIYFCYPECYCPCVKRVPKALSKTWCLCTLGNAAGIFQRVFGYEVSVNLLESIKSGGSRCVIEVCL